MHAHANGAGIDACEYYYRTWPRDAADGGGDDDNARLGKLQDDPNDRPPVEQEQHRPMLHG
jgi:hypothetical protein